MPDRPIIFSAPMVRALLDGRKTQTRRVLKHKVIDLSIAPRVEVDHPSWIQFIHPQGGPLTCVKWPYAPGDRLWVREAFYRCDVCAYLNHAEGANSAGTGSRKCCASCDELLPKAKRSPIHMPRWASRLTLTVTQVRVQRLQDIGEEDAQAEGCEAYRFPGPWWQGYRDMGDGDLLHQQVVGEEPPDWMIEPHRMRDHSHLNRSAVEAFTGLWNSLHGPDAWDANPWVAAITFTVHRGNIDGGAA